MADLAARGILKPDDLAWKRGTPAWVAAPKLLAFPGLNGKAVLGAPVTWALVFFGSVLFAALSLSSR